MIKKSENLLLWMMLTGIVAGFISSYVWGEAMTAVGWIGEFFLSCLGVRLYYSREETLLDSGGGVRTALELLPGGGLVTVYNADVISDVDVQMLACQTPEKGVALALVPNPEHHPDGDFSMTSDMVVEDGLPRYTYSGISVWDEAALSSFQSGEAFPLVQPMRQLMGESRLAAAVHHGVWFDIGRPRDLMRARAFLNRRGWS